MLCTDSLCASYAERVMQDVWSQRGHIHMLEINHALENSKISILPLTLICKIANTLYSALP